MQKCFRIRKAQEMLHSTNWKVKEIVPKSGYQNINSFNRMFKKFTGMTPGEYRKKIE
ncbi:AraC family transcriptional regulator [Paenibacillus sp. J2TS4]|uniref:helix-turn-helix domain-containing protein n=1 Tax=Paenibacillus sp. J2TS4 TaxID=2807194 RepID=UPI001BD198BC|nr:AraC family transcriptional regulator [Paenibacillus sp. J2TS4]